MTDWTKLHDAALDGTIIEINEGDDLEAETCEGHTPLLVATLHSHYNTADMFLKKGANVNCRDDSERTPLHHAAERGDIRMVHLLVNNGADLNVRSKNGSTPLLLASFESHQGIVELLIDQGANIYTCDTCVNIYCCSSFSGNLGLFRKWSLMHHAARYGWVQTIHFLVTKGANLNVKGGSGESPLMVAIDFIQREVVEVLLNYNVEINFSDRSRHSPLHHAIKGPSLRSYNLDLVKLLVSKGADIELKGWEGQTPLMFAMSLQRKEAVELLMNAGANIYCLDEDNWSLLHFAAENGWLDVAKVLLEKGLDINAMTYHINENTSVSTSSPLHVACVFFKVKMVQYLLESGADPFVENKMGALPYTELLMEEYFELEDESDIDMDTGLTLTSDQKQQIIVKIVKLFIEHGGYIRPPEYKKILEKDALKAGLLQDESACSQAIINKFNNRDMLDIYKIPMFAQNLAGIEHMKLFNHSERAQAIQLSVRQEIQTKGYCDLLETQPMALSLLAIRPLVDYYHSVNIPPPPPVFPCICPEGEHLELDWEP